MAELAADALTDLPKVDVPRSLRAVATFAPAKRVRLLVETLDGAVAGLRRDWRWVRVWGPAVGRAE